MALTELQLPLKNQFYSNLQSAANKMNSLMHTWADLSEFIGLVQTADLDAMGIPSGQVRTDLTNFRQALQDMLSLWEGNPVTPTNSPSDVIDKIRSM
jgi:hypothetical protein